MTAEPANPRAARTKAALVAAGRRLFSERPIDAVTVDDIVQAAEVGKGSFYNHFTDREALARAIATQIRASIESAVGTGNQPEANDGESESQQLQPPRHSLDVNSEQHGQDRGNNRSHRGDHAHASRGETLVKRGYA